MRWTQASLNSLNRVLANYYPLLGDGMRIARAADLRIPQIEFSNKANLNWFAIIQQAKIQSRVDQLLEIVLLEFPDDETLLQIKSQSPPPPVDGPSVSWKAAGGQLEKIIGSKSTLVAIASLELGIKRARSVVRIRRADGGLGTGFVISGNRIITNNHVLPDETITKTAVAQFNYQKTVDGLDAQLEEFPLEIGGFVTSIADDWSVVKFTGDASKWGELPLKSRTVVAGDFVNIIQHPGGGQKQLSFAANVVAFVGGGRVQYLTDTLPGSSGSPVFDADWNLVALHHSGGWLVEPGSATKNTFYRNEGIAITTVIEGLAASALPGPVVTQAPIRDRTRE